jgi:peptide/nickel transport system permease protein
VRTLRAVGLSDRSIFKHVAKNAGVPIVTVLGLQASRLLGATVIVEAVFGIHGAGSLIVDLCRAVTTRSCKASCSSWR